MFIQKAGIEVPYVRLDKIPPKELMKSFQLTIMAYR